jgi:hypothetical protein
VVFVYTLCAYGFIAFISICDKKKNYQNKHIPIQKMIKQYTPVLTVLLVYCLILPFNPMLGRMSERATVSEKTDKEIQIIENASDDELNPSNEDELNPSNDDELGEEEKLSLIEMKEYIEKNFDKKRLHRQFILENYPYKYDPEFWYNFLQNDVIAITDYRFVELSMVKRVVEINNNTFDKFFGITNTRLQNIFNIEKDFVVQYYALGIVGLLLVFAPYFILIGIFIFSVIKNKFENLNILNLLSVITILFMFGIAFFTGNLLNSVSFTIYFTICFVLLFKKN